MDEPSSNGDSTSALRQVVSQDDLRELFISARGGNQQATECLLKRFERVVTTQTRIYLGRFPARYDEELLRQEARCAMIRVIKSDSLDLDKLEIFERYAASAIRNAFNDLVRQDSGSTRVQWENIAEFEKTKIVLSKEMGRNPTDEEVYKKLDWKHTKLCNHLAHPKSAIATFNSLDDQTQDDSERSPIANLTNHGRSESSVTDDTEATMRQLHAEIERLSIDEQRVITRRYLVANRATQRMCASLLGLTRYRVEQLENSALEKLREALQP